MVEGSGCEDGSYCTSSICSRFWAEMVKSLSHGRTQSTIETLNLLTFMKSIILSEKIRLDSAPEFFTKLYSKNKLSGRNNNPLYRTLKNSLSRIEVSFFQRVIKLNVQNQQPAILEYRILPKEILPKKQSLPGMVLSILSEGPGRASGKTTEAVNRCVLSRVAVAEKRRERGEREREEERGGFWYSRPLRFPYPTAPLSLLDSLCSFAGYRRGELRAMRILVYLSAPSWSSPSQIPPRQSRRALFPLSL